MTNLFDLRVRLDEPSPSQVGDGVLALIKLKGNETGEWEWSGEFRLELPKAELAELRWYLEEYWKWPYQEFKARGEAVEALLPKLGKRLYDALLPTGEALGMFRAWEKTAKQQGARQQISIMSALPAMLSLPWELLHDGQGFLALRKLRPLSIVRRMSLLDEGETVPFALPLRVLLVTARPDDAGFVDPRGIARELLDEVQKEVEAGTMVVEMLRPPTLAALSERLGDPTLPPVHVLHFDGHGTFQEEGLSLHDGRLLKVGGQGQLAFEDAEGKMELVEAETLGDVLNRGGVRLAVLTACQSAMGAADDVFSSVAARLVQSGVDGVVAMSASVLVASATRYVEGFYRFLAKGAPVPTAHELARQALYADPRRHPFRIRPDDEAQPITLYDWWLPHYYQQRPVSLTEEEGRAKGKSNGEQLTAEGLLGGQMPSPPRYGFHGRARELWAIERALLRGKLVVLHGFGGVGKTALAREAAAWLTRTGLHGAAYFHPFETGSDAVALLSGLATFLGAYEDGFDPNNVPDALARLRPALAARRPLVIADNLESILEEGNAPLRPAEARTQLWAVLVALRDSGAGVLLTTRTTHFEDGRLARGKLVAHRRLDGLHPEDAYALATELLQSLEIPRERAPYPQVRDLLVQLDHHPLAIQLVLPKLQEYPLPRIRDDFATLLDRFEDDAESGRNKSLLASLDYSLNRLTDAQRALLPRLAVFEGGASEDDLLVITEIPEDEWRNLRTALERAALVKPELVANYTAPFLRFHPVLTPYLRRQPGADDPALPPRHAARYHALARYLYQEDTRNPIPTRALFLRELPNLRRALAFLVAQRDAEAASEMTDSLSRFLGALGLGREREEVRRMVQPLIEAGGAGLTQAEFVSESGQGEYELERGDLKAAHSRFTRLLTLITAQPTESVRGPGSYEHCLTLGRLARCLSDGGQPAHAEQRLGEALQVIDALIVQAPGDAGLLRQRGALLTDLGDVMSKQGKYGEARVAYENSLESKRTIGGDKRGEGVVLIQLGTLALMQRQYEEAKQRYQEALALFRTLGEPKIEATAWHQLGIVAEEQEQWAEAERAHRESLTIKERQGDSAGAARSCNQLAIVAQLAGRPTEAEGWYKRALAFPGLPAPHEASMCYNLANLLLTSGTRLAEARGYAERALTIDETIESEIWTTLNILAKIADKQSDPTAARAYRRRERDTFAAFAGNRWHIDQQFGSLITAIAAAAQGNEGARAAIEGRLPHLEEAGWKIADATRRLWAGERDWHALTEDLDRQDALLILRVLETLADPAAAPQVPDAAPPPDLLARFEPLLQGIAAAAQGAEDKHEEIEALLPKLEENGWQIADPVRRIWAGERDAAALTQGIDGNSAALIRRVLDILAEPSDEEDAAPAAPMDDEPAEDPSARIGALLGSLPDALRQAMQRGDAAAFRDALQALPQEEQQRVRAVLMALQRLR